MDTRGHRATQSNILLLTLLTVSSFAARRDEDILSGVLWGLGIIVKPFALAFALHMWRRPKALLSSVLTVIVLILASGPSLTVEYSKTVWTPVEANLGLLPANVSLLGVLNTYWESSAMPLYVVLAAGGFLLALLVSRKVCGEHQRAALSVATCLVFWPAVQIHYLVFAIIPISIVLAWANHTPASLYVRALVGFSLAALFLTPYLSHRQPFTSLPFWGLVILWLITLAAVRSRTVDSQPI